MVLESYAWVTEILGIKKETDRSDPKSTVAQRTATEAVYARIHIGRP